MIKLAATIGLCAVVASSAPARAGDGWNHNHGGGGIGPGAAVALGLGSLALGTALANPYWRGWPGYYAPPLVGYYTPPYAYQPRWCMNPYGQYYVC